LAQSSLTLVFQDGRVSIDAAGVPAREILAQWAKVGGTKVVGGDKLANVPVTLKLENVTERKALDIILRNVAGYMAAPRIATIAGSSSYDRILILPTSVSASAASNNTPAAAAANMRPGISIANRPQMPPRPPGMRGPDADGDEIVGNPDDSADNGVVNQQPVFTFPQPQTPGNQVFQPVPANGQPVIALQPGQNGTPTIYNFMPNTGAAAPPAGSFNVIGSPTPGMIQQPPPTQGQPGPKPPGDQN
jgi:hypothetical protein